MVGAEPCGYQSRPLERNEGSPYTLYGWTGSVLRAQGSETWSMAVLN